MSETQDNSEMDELERRRKELELEQAKLENERLRERSHAERHQYQGGGHHTGGLAMASFVLGIVSLPAIFLGGLGWICGILALVFGQIALKDPDYTVDAHRKARAGKMMGIISIGATCLFWFVVGIVGGAALIIVFSILGLLGYLGFLAGGNRPVQYP